MRAVTGIRTNISLSLTLLPLLYTFTMPSPLRMFPSTLLSLPSSLPLSHFHPGITLVDETSPVDKPSNSDQVTGGVQFAYALPQQQSNQEDNQDDTALVGSHPCVCVSVGLCALCVTVCMDRVHVVCEFPSLNQSTPAPSHPTPPHNQHTHTHRLLTQRV